MKGILWVDTEVNGKNVRTEYMQKYISYEIKIEHPFLLIPVKIKEETERLSFYLEDQKVLSIRSSLWKRERLWIIMLRFLLRRG